MEGTQNELKDKDNARGVAARMACQLSACSRRNELTEKDVLARLGADLQKKAELLVQHTDCGH